MVHHRFTVRPARPARADQRDAFRVFLSPSALMILNLRADEPCVLQVENENGPKHTAVAWTAAEKIHDTVVLTSATLQDIYGLKLGDKIIIEKLDEPIPTAESVILRDATGTDQLSERDKRGWEWGLEIPLQKAGIVARGMLFDKVEVRGQKRMFIIRDVRSAATSTSSTLFSFKKETQIRILDDADFDASIPYTVQSFELDANAIGGLSAQIQTVNEVLKDLLDDDPPLTLPAYYRPDRGILLYGPQGTGKKFLIDKVSALPWAKVLRVPTDMIQHEQGETKLRNLFREACEHQPSLVLVDRLEILASSHTSSEQQPPKDLVSAFLDGFDSVKTGQVLVIAKARHPNLVDKSLRAPGRFDLEIEVPIPTASQRHEILTAIRGLSNEPNDSILQDIKERTHGFVAADLFRLLQMTVKIAKKRCLASYSTQDGILSGRRSLTTETDQSLDDNMSIAPTIHPAIFNVIQDDVDQALNKVGPATLQEIFIDTPNTRWSDIGGQEETKRQLQLAVEGPLKFAADMKHFGLDPKKGLLLYGPPGCSKTLLVKALATESSLNFLAVKGGEFMSMYVGESERAIRETFRKARAASPCILFFDEIDSIATRRPQSGSVNSSLNVLTTLLTEMDGLEELKNVLVVGATNKPAALDDALLRPGRFDDLIFVGLPDEDERREIFEIRLKGSHSSGSVDASTLAEMTQGFSGAEIVAICQTAGELAMKRTIDQQLRLETAEIEMEEFAKAIRTRPRRISPEMVEEYHKWRDSIK
ncbi:MAG: hypothetical protein Q9227_009322 [Pyrenula ochraceoflavens]